MAQSVFINELIYDSKILVKGKSEHSVESLVEVAGPAGTDLANWTLVLYDGTGNISKGAPYATQKQGQCLQRLQLVSSLRLHARRSQ